MEAKFSFNIKVIDETGIWQAIWNNIRDQLNLHFLPLSYKEYNNTKSLANLNIKLVQTQENLNSFLFTLYIFKINSVAELKGPIKDNILKILQREKEIFPILLMDIENSESALKTCIKACDKIKSELKNNNLKLLPLNTNYIKLSDLVNDFFRELKNKISLEFNKRFVIFSTNIDTLKISKFDNIENTYSYISNKDNLIEYLQAADFWSEIIKICENDANIEFKLLENFKTNSNNSYFNDSISLIDFNEYIIKQKIHNKTLTNLDYQIYLFNLMIRSYRNIREFKKMFVFVNKFISNLSNMKSYFPSIYYFNFWSFNFIGKLIPFYKSMKSNYLSPYEEEMNIKAQNDILQLLKRSLKNLAKILNYEIPNAKIFKILANINQENINNLNINLSNNINSSYTNNNLEGRDTLQISFENQLQNKIKNHMKVHSQNNISISMDDNFSNFLKDVKANLDEKSKILLFSREKLLEQYLTCINDIEKTYQSLKENRLMLKVQLEKLPILFVLGRFSDMKQILLQNIQSCKRGSDNNSNTNKGNLGFIHSQNETKTNSEVQANNINYYSEDFISQGLQKWPLIKEYMCSLLILLLNSLDKSTENIRIIIDILNVYQSNDVISNYFNLEDKNNIKNILAKYLDDNININLRNSTSNNSSSAFSLNGEREKASNLLKINLNELISFEYFVSNKNQILDATIKSSNAKVTESLDQHNRYYYSCKAKKISFFNENTTNNIYFDFLISNKTDLEMKVTSLSIYFFDEINNRKLKYDYNPFIALIANEEADNKESEMVDTSSFFLIKASDKTQFKFDLDLKHLDSLKNFDISSLVIDKVYLYLTWGILGIYKFKNQNSIIYLKKNDFTIHSELSHFIHKNRAIYNNNFADFLSNSENKKDRKEYNNIRSLFFNVEIPLFIKFENMKSFDFNNYFIDIDLILQNNESNLANINENNAINNNNNYNSDNQNIKHMKSFKFSEETNEKPNINIEDGDIRLEIFDEMTLFKLNSENLSNDDSIKDQDLSFLISLPNTNENINFKDTSKNKTKNNHNNEYDATPKVTHDNTLQEKNIKIYNSSFQDLINKTSKGLPENDIFNKYILNYNRGSENKVQVLKNINLSQDNMSTQSENKENFFLVLSLLINNSKFKNIYKQKLILNINIRDIKNNNNSIFFTKEEYDLELKHLFSCDTTCVMRTLSERSYSTQNIASEKSDNLDSFNNLNDHNNNISHSDQEFKNRTFILVQNSISLMMDIDQIFIEVNKNFSKISQKQNFKLVNKIPYDFDIPSNQLIGEDLNNDNQNNIDKSSFFKNLCFKFINKKAQLYRNSQNLSEGLAKFSIDDYINNSDNQIDSIKIVENLGAKASIDILKVSQLFPVNKNLKNDYITGELKFSEFSYFYPLDFIMEKVNEMKKIEYVITIKPLIKSLKNKIFNSPIILSNPQSRNSISNALLANNPLVMSLTQSPNLIVERKDSKIHNFNKNLNLHKLYLSSNEYADISAFEIFKEMQVQINVQKLKKSQSFFMMKIKENNNWTCLGKTRIIEKFKLDENEKTIVIKLIPLQDGFIRLPELEFSDFLGQMEFSIIETDHTKKNSVNHTEFRTLNKNTILIQGNEKILKINPVTFTGIKVNVI